MESNPPLPNGVFAASLTPLKEDLSPDPELTVRHNQNLLNQGCDGLAILGTTGEANSFSTRERKEILESIVDGGISPHCLMVGTGCCSIPETVELTRHAVSLNVGGILLLPPFYYKGVSDSGLLNFFTQVIEQVSSDALKIYLYHFPRQAQVDFSFELIEELLSRFPSTVVGMKDSSGDFNHMKETLNRFPQLKLFAGTERFLLAVLKVGGVGCVSATTNVTSDLAAKVWSLFQEGRIEEAEQTQDAVNHIREAFQGKPFVPGLKAFLAQRESNPDWLHLRPPLCALTEGETQELLNQLQAVHLTP